MIIKPKIKVEYERFSRFKIVVLLRYFQDVYSKNV